MIYHGLITMADNFAHYGKRKGPAVKLIYAVVEATVKG